MLGLIVVSGCAHAVQPTPRSWTPPREYAHCAVGETVKIDGVRYVMLDCPDGSVKAIDYRTKADRTPKG